MTGFSSPGQRFSGQPTVWSSGARAEAGKRDWLSRLIEPPTKDPPSVLVGPIASGEKVLASTRSDLHRFLRRNYSDALAGEMEAFGFLSAAFAHRQVEALMVKGISDLLDKKAESDARGSQNVASAHASAFAFQVLAKLDLGEDDSKAKPIWSDQIPRRNPNFAGREALLDDLRRALTSGSPAALTQAIFGLGGVGKTQLALEYAYRHAGDYDLVWWVRSKDPSSLISDYAGLADELGLEVEDPGERAMAVRRWLEQNRGWLLIFDNAQRQQDLEKSCRDLKPAT